MKKKLCRICERKAECMQRHVPRGNTFVLWRSMGWGTASSTAGSRTGLTIIFFYELIP